MLAGMSGLSKSRLMSFLQCPRRLWLEKNRPDLARVDAARQAVFDTGHAVGALARRLYDPRGTGAIIDGERGMDEALRATAALVANPVSTPLFEATFQRDGLLIRADVLDRERLRLIEVKSSAGLKAEHTTDCAIQAWVLDASPARPKTVALAHIDSQFTYGGDGDYNGLMVEQDLSTVIAAPLEQVPAWLSAAKNALRGDEPEASIGTRCRRPYPCPFIDHCWPQTEYRLTTLPGVSRRLDELIAKGYRDVRELPPELVRGEDALRTWRAARSGRAEIGGAARGELALLAWPRYYLDFETIGPAIPRWPGTRPYQAIPFQWSLHVERAPGRLEHSAYLDLSGNLPVRGVAQALLRDVGTLGPVLTYTGYEKSCLTTLAAFCPDLAGPLGAVIDRLVDLHPIVKRNYYHPAMHGSWSIKAVMRTIDPDMDYALLEGVQDGSGAQAAFTEALAPDTSATRQREIEAQLLRYCAQDTLAMVRIAHFLSGA